MQEEEARELKLVGKLFIYILLRCDDVLGENIILFVLDALNVHSGHIISRTKIDCINRKNIISSDPFEDDLVRGVFALELEDLEK